MRVLWRKHWTTMVNSCRKCGRENATRTSWPCSISRNQILKSTNNVKRLWGMCTLDEYVPQHFWGMLVHWVFLNKSYIWTCFLSCNSFGDRGKRLKLQQFLAKKADALYDKSNLEKTVEPIKQELGDEGTIPLLSDTRWLIMYCAMMCNKSVVHVVSEFYATMPGLDTFVTMEKSQRIRNFLEVIIYYFNNLCKNK